MSTTEIPEWQEEIPHWEKEKSEHREYLKSGVRRLFVKHDYVEEVKKSETWQRMATLTDMKSNRDLENFTNEFYISLIPAFCYLDSTFNEGSRKAIRENYEDVVYVNMLIGYLKYMLVPLSFQANFTTLAEAGPNYEEAEYPDNISKTSLYMQESMKEYAKVWGKNNRELQTKIQNAILEYRQAAKESDKENQKPTEEEETAVNQLFSSAELPSGADKQTE